MNAPICLITVCLGSVLQPLGAQFSSRAPASASKSVHASVVSPPAGGGSFLGGTDDCAMPHASAGSGNVSVPYDLSALTTGTTGQNEAGCLFASTTGIDSDGWWDWTATVRGVATLSNCGDSVDTKVAIWPSSTCPSAGTSFACMDDSCGLQTEVAWNVVPNTTYTIQLGTFPGASSGSGNFVIEQRTYPICGELDDASSENSIGLVAGGEIGWLQGFSCLGKYDAVLTAYGSVANWSVSRIAAYEQPGGDGSSVSGLQQVALVNTVVVNAGTDTLNTIPLGTRTHRSSLAPAWTWIMATAVHDPGEFPAPLDETFGTPNAWAVGSTAGTGMPLDTVTLLNNDVPPVRIAAAGFPGTWLIRADCTDTTCPIGTKICLGDGSGTLCPCLNDGGIGEGCANGTGAGGVLTASGLPSVSSDTMSLTADGVINNNGLFFQGNNTIGGGTGIVFGDGIRCCGGSVVRIQVVNPPGTSSPATAQMTETATTNGPGGTITAGTKKCYQYWYRDPATSPCGAQFNLTNAVTITWQP